MMTSMATRVVKQRGVVVALLTAAIVFAVLTVQSLLSLFATEVTSGIIGGGFFAFGSHLWGSYAISGLGSIVVLSGGVFLALWIIAPIAAELRLFHVVTRSILAAGVGAVLVFLFALLVAFLGGFGFSGGFSSNLLANLNFNGSSVVSTLAFSVSTTIQTFSSAAPVVVLAGVVLWIWLDKHPRDHHVSGMVDEV